MYIVFVCVAAMVGIVRGAAVATTAQHDHFDQVQIACTAGHVHGVSLPLLIVECIGSTWGESYSRRHDVHAAGGQCSCVCFIMQPNFMGLGGYTASVVYISHS